MPSRKVTQLHKLDYELPPMTQMEQQLPREKDPWAWKADAFNVQQDIQSKFTFRKPSGHNRQLDIRNQYQLIHRGILDSKSKPYLIVPPSPPYFSSLQILPAILKPTFSSPVNASPRTIAGKINGAKLIDAASSSASALLYPVASPGFCL